MKKYFENLAKALLGMPFGELDKNKQAVIKSIAEGEPIAENVNTSFREQLTMGQRLADKISAFGGSWTFILLFLGVLLVWISVNTFYFLTPETAFDPYPYILLNLVLSTLAALQAPIIMMSQNRQIAKDRLKVAENYKVSLKMDLEIIRLHEKVDQLTKKLESSVTIHVLQNGLPLCRAGKPPQQSHFHGVPIGNRSSQKRFKQLP